MKSKKLFLAFLAVIFFQTVISIRATELSRKFGKVELTVNDKDDSVLRKPIQGFGSIAYFEIPKRETDLNKAIEFIRQFVEWATIAQQNKVKGFKKEIGKIGQTEGEFPRFSKYMMSINEMGEPSLIIDQVHIIFGRNQIPEGIDGSWTPDDAANMLSAIANRAELRKELSVTELFK